MVGTPAHHDLWLEAVRSLLDEHHRAFPSAQLAQLVDETFEPSTSEWAWAEPDGSLGGEFSRLPPGSSWSWSGPPIEWVLEAHGGHPLLTWFRCSRDPRPMSIARVPTTVVPARAQRAYLEYSSPMGLDHQLSIPYLLEPGRYRAFILGHCEHDFSDADVDLARWIQPLLTLLNVHVSSSATVGVEQARDVHLTPRETTVLALLADGATAYTIARRLRLSPRTVHNHLQRVYRKLEVQDRMGAVIRAQSLGILRPWPTGPADRVADLERQDGRVDDVIPIDRANAREPRRSFAYAVDPGTGQLVDVS